jgi:hypothetical protein
MARAGHGPARKARQEGILPRPATAGERPTRVRESNRRDARERLIDRAGIRSFPCVAHVARLAMVDVASLSSAHVASRAHRLTATSDFFPVLYTSVFCPIFHVMN